MLSACSWLVPGSPSQRLIAGAHVVRTGIVVIAQWLGGESEALLGIHDLVVVQGLTRLQGHGTRQPRCCCSRFVFLAVSARCCCSSFLLWLLWLLGLWWWLWLSLLETLTAVLCRQRIGAVALMSFSTCRTLQTVELIKGRWMLVKTTDQDAINIIESA